MIPLHVCHLVSGDVWGGLEALALALAHAQSRRDDLRVSVIVLNEGRFAEEARGAGLDVRLVAERDRGWRALHRDVGAALSELRPDVVHSHRYKENLLAFLLAPSRGIRSAVTIHGFEPPTRWRERARVALRDAITFRLGYRAGARFAAVSRDLLERYRIRAGHGVVVPNGVALPARVPRPAPWRSRDADSPPLIGWVGRLVPIKGVELLLDALKDLGGAHAPHLVLIGDGPERATLETQVAHLGLGERVRFTGFVAAPGDWFSRMDLFVLCSRHEGAPIALLEAMAHGVPAIAAAVGGIPDLIGDSGAARLVAGRDAEEWARAIRALLDDPALGVLGERGRELVERRFSVDAMVERYVALYRGMERR